MVWLWLADPCLSNILARGNQGVQVFCLDVMCPGGGAPDISTFCGEPTRLVSIRFLVRSTSARPLFSRVGVRFSLFPSQMILALAVRAMIIGEA